MNSIFKDLFVLNFKAPALDKEDLSKESDKTALKKSLSKLQSRLEEETWLKENSEEMIFHFKSIFIDMLNLVLIHYNQNPISDMTQMSESINKLSDKKIKAVFLDPTPQWEILSTKRIAEIRFDQIEKTSLVLEDVFTKIKKQLLNDTKKKCRTALDAHYTRLKNQVVLFIIVVYSIFFVGKNVKYAIQNSKLSKIAVNYFEDVQTVEVAIEKWQKDMGTIFPLTAQGEIDRGMSHSSFEQQLISKGGDKGQWLNWRGPYISQSPGLFQNFEFDIINISGAAFDLNNVKGTDIPLTARTIYISFFEVEEILWEKIDLLIDGDSDLSKREKRTHGRVIYLPWNHNWMAIYLKHSEQ